MNIFEKYPRSKFLNELPDDSDFFRPRERIVDLFSFFDGLEDPNFEKELDQDPHAALWEMMVAKILKSEGYQPTRSTDGGPDFVVEKDGKRIFIEATCRGPGYEGHPDKVQPIRYGTGIAQAIPEAQIVMRISGALENKKEKYDQYLKDGKVSEGDICIIAICSSRIDRAAGLWPPAIMRATHGLGNPYVLFGRSEGFVEEGVESRESITNSKGEEKDTMFFLSMDNSLISAVLYSECSFFSLGADFFKESLLLHNPNAHVPLPLGFTNQIKEI
ncbi:MAG: hypothetical protein ABI604_08865 [Nitrospirota bacterium]